MDDCIFCKIVKGECPSMKIFEDDKTLVFMDISRDIDGHMLVIPKMHVTNILDADEETLCAVVKTINKVSNHLVENCGYQGVNILNANDKSAGQSVFHLHFHIIPRKADDGVDAYPHFSGAKQTMEEIFDKIKMI